MVLDSYLDLSSFWRQEDLPGLPGAGAGLRGLPGLPAMMRCELCGKHCSNGARLLQHMNAMHKPDPADVVQQETFLPAAAAAVGVVDGGDASTSQSDADRLQYRYATVRIKQHVSRDAMQDIKRAFQEVVNKLKEDVKSRVEANLVPGKDVNEVLGDAFGAFETATRRDSELEYLRAQPGYVEPRARLLKQKYGGSSGDELIEEFYAYDSPFEKTLEAMFATCPEVWEQVKSFLERASKGEAGCGEYDEKVLIVDMADGLELKRFLGRLKLQPGETPLVLMLYYDGLEVSNGLGQARGTHELACFYFAVVNLDQELRLKHANLRLATICLKRAVSEAGMDAVIGGKSAEGSSWGASMLRLSKRAGVTLMTPEGPRKFRGGTAIVSADTPAGAELLGYKEAVGPSTISICKCCHCLQHGDPPPYRQANSFLCELKGWKRHCAGRQQRFRLRGREDLEQYLSKLKELARGAITKTELFQWKQQMGVNSFLSAMWPIPFYSASAGCPVDVMHILYEGVARNVTGAVAYVMIRHWGIHREDVVLAISTFCRASGHKRAQYPHINSTRMNRLAEGTSDGRPRGDCDFPGTAMQMAFFGCRAPLIWGPVVSAAKKRTLEWQALLYLSRICNACLQKTFTHAQLAELDKNIWLLDKIILGCPNLTHTWKPKNHYLSHVPLDILRWGPCRGYLCEPFEHENQYSKGAVTHGNFANPLRDVAEGKALSVALEGIQGMD